MAMARSERTGALLRLQAGALMALVMAASLHATTINIVNSCSENLNACKTDSTGALACFDNLSASGGSYSLDVGSTWTGGVIWAYPSSEGSGTTTGNNAKPQANLAEFTINSGGEDYYDISNVNAYNLGMEITVTSIANGVTPSGTTCTNPICSISDLNSFCTSPNTLTGAPGDGCYNTDGTGTVATSGTEQFASACPDAYSYSTDNANHVYGCPTTSNYQVTFCP
jgi:hypothetical protein